MTNSSSSKLGISRTLLAVAAAPMLAAAAVLLLLLRRGVVLTLLLCGVAGVVIALAGAPVG